MFAGNLKLTKSASVSTPDTGRDIGVSPMILAAARAGCPCHSFGLAIRKGASDTEKQPTGRGPEGCVENGPTAALLVGYVSL
jgi:hypothetical protein